MRDLLLFHFRCFKIIGYYFINRQQESYRLGWIGPMPAPLLGCQQRPVSDPPLDPHSPSGFHGLSPQFTAVKPRLASDLWSPPLSGGDLCGSEPFSRHLLSSLQLDLRGPDEGQRQERQRLSLSRPAQGNLSLSLAPELQEEACR